MIILDATTKSLQFKLGANVTTNQLPFAASYINSSGTTTTPTEQDGVSNNTTAVTLVSAPASSTQTLVKNIVIQNADTAAATVTVIYNNNSTLRNIIVATLAVGDNLVYEDGNGWAIIDKNGNLKTAVYNSVVSSVSNSDGSLTISPTTGNVVASLSSIGLQKYLRGGFVNKFRNPSFDVAQRGASGSMAVAGTPTGNYYTLDGWMLVPTGGSVTWAQISTAGSYEPTNMQITGASGVTDVILKQRIESSIVGQLFTATGGVSALTVQISVYNGTNATLNPTLTVKYANSTNNFSSMTTDVNAVSLQSIANNSEGFLAYTWTPGSGNYTDGIEISFDFGNNFGSASDELYVISADVRATPGLATGQNNSPPTPELRPVAVEFPNCQRYFNSTFGNGNAPAQNAGLSGALGSQAYGATAGELYTQWNFPGQMRAAPTITTYNPSAANANWRDVSGSSDVVVSVDPDSAKGLAGVLIGSQTTALTAGHRCYIHATASAEL